MESRNSLFIGSLTARAAGTAMSLPPRCVRSQQEMRVDQAAEQAKRFVMFDKDNPAHVGCEVVNFTHCPAQSSLAGSAVLQIKCEVLYVIKALIPLSDGLAIDRAN